RRRRTDATRMPDVPPLRPLQGRSGDLSPQGGGGAVAGPRPAEDRPRAAARARRERGAARGRRGVRSRADRARGGEREGGPIPRPGARGSDGVQPVSTLEFRDAIRDALAEELERDPSVVFFGEDIAAPGGVFKVTTELLERF